MKRVLFGIVALLVTSLVTAQKVLNDYKYVLIPVQYEFQKTENQYQLNSLLQYKFNQLGLEAYLETDDLPKEVKTNSCSYLKPIINAKSNMFATKAVVDLVDCDGKTVFATAEGTSRSKNVRVSYLEALRNSLQSFDGFVYIFTPKEEYVVEVEKVADEIKHSENKQAVTTERVLLTHSANYLFKGERYVFLAVIDGPFYKNIIKKGTDISIGSLSKSSKKGIYHVLLNKQKGIGYYDENGSFLVEIIDYTGEIQLHKFQEITE